MAKPRKKITRQGRKRTMSRRTFLQDVMVFSAAATAVSLPAATAGVRAAGTSAESAQALASVAGGTGLKVLTPEEGRLLTLVLDRLVPAEGTKPGAGDIGITAYIDGVLADAPHLRRPILDVLTRVQTAGAFAPDSGASLDEVLRGVERDEKASFEVLLQATYTGYYNHPQVLHAIGWVGPDEPTGPPPAFDQAMLREVLERGPIYRDV
jgi:hypothetical protein